MGDLTKSGTPNKLEVQQVAVLTGCDGLTIKSRRASLIVTATPPGMGIEVGAQVVTVNGESPNELASRICRVGDPFNHCSGASVPHALGQVDKFASPPCPSCDFDRLSRSQGLDVALMKWIKAVKRERTVTLGVVVPEDSAINGSNPDSRATQEISRHLDVSIVPSPSQNLRLRPRAGLKEDFDELLNEVAMLPPPGTYLRFLQPFRRFGSIWLHQDDFDDLDPFVDPGSETSGRTFFQHKKRRTSEGEGVGDSDNLSKGDVSATQEGRSCFAEPGRNDSTSLAVDKPELIRPSCIAEAIRDKNSWRSWMEKVSKEIEEFLYKETKKWAFHCNICAKVMSRGAHDHLRSKAHFMEVCKTYNRLESSNASREWVQPFTTPKGVYCLHHLSGDWYTVDSNNVEVLAAKEEAYDSQHSHSSDNAANRKMDAAFYPNVPRTDTHIDVSINAHALERVCAPILEEGRATKETNNCATMVHGVPVRAIRRAKRRLGRMYDSQSKETKHDMEQVSEGISAPPLSDAEALKSIVEWKRWIQPKAEILMNLLEKDYRATKEWRHFCAVCSTAGKKVGMNYGARHFCGRLHYKSVHDLSELSSELEQVFQTHLGTWVFNHLSGALYPQDDIAKRHSTWTGA